MQVLHSYSRSMAWYAGADRLAVAQPLADRGEPPVDLGTLHREGEVPALDRDVTFEPLVEGELLGIKGQYLLFAGGAINIRKFTAYEVELST